MYATMIYHNTSTLDGTNKTDIKEIEITILPMTMRNVEQREYSSERQNEKAHMKGYAKLRLHLSNTDIYDRKYRNQHKCL